MTDVRTFIKVHDGIDEHPKIEALSDRAFRHLITLWCYCSRNFTDGKVADRTWKRITTPATARELIDHQLATPTSDGVEMHDYLEHQRSRAEVEELSEKRRIAGQRGGKARAKNQASATASAQANAEQNRSRAEKRREEPPYPPTDEPAPPDPDRSSAAADGDFETFWHTYPRKIDEAKARAAWRRATRDTPAETILAALDRQAEQLRETETRFVPKPDTWLRNQRWTDQPPEEPDPFAEAHAARPDNWRELLENPPPSGPMWDKPPPEPPPPSRMPDSVRAAIRRPRRQAPTIRPTGSETP